MRSILKRRYWLLYAICFGLINIAALVLLKPAPQNPGTIAVKNYPVLGSVNVRLDAIAEARGNEWITNPHELSAETLAKGSDDLNRFLDGYVKNGKARWIRISLDWGTVQASEGAKLEWFYYDPIIRAIKAHGLKVLVLLNGAQWSAAPTCTLKKDRHECQPVPATFAKFAGQLAAHYNGSQPNLMIDAWEIGNEVNCWSWDPHDPALYTQTVVSAYQAIKAQSPAAVVLAGGAGDCATRPANAESPPTWDSRDWLIAMYEHGAKGYFDALSHHPYAYDNVDDIVTYSPWAKMMSDFPSPSYETRKTRQCDKPPCIYSQSGQSLHAIMAKYGDKTPSGVVKPIWMTEMGVSAPMKRPTLFWPQAWSTEQQKRHLDAAWSVIAQAPKGVYGPLFWFSYVDPDVGHSSGYTSESNESYFGLIAADGTAKPALADFAKFNELAAQAASCTQACDAPVGDGW